MIVLIGMSALLGTSCGSSRKVSEVSSFRVQDSRDSVRVEQVMVAVHDTIMETTTIIVRESEQGDTLRLEKVTERDRVRDRTGFNVQDSRVTIKRDTVYVEKRDSVLVQTNTNLTNPTNKRSTIVSSLKWIFWIIVAVIALTITLTITKTIKNLRI